MLWRLIARRRRVLTALLAPLAAFVSVATGDRRSPGGGPFEAAAAVAMAPLQSAAAASFSWLGAIGGALPGGGLRRENEQLRREVERLRREVQENREWVASAARLERLLEYRASAPFAVTAAGVIGRDANGLYRTVLIDRGSADGLEHQQAVLAPDGVVGRVIKVFPHSALVLLVTDRSSGIDAIVQRTRDQGTVQGRGAGCELKYLDRSAEVEVGDFVVTSGLGGRFPKGVLIGQVSAINRGGELFQSVDIRPSAGLERLEEVLVVTGAPGERQ
jgi:rod shape-determining protein MreC